MGSLIRPVVGHRTGDDADGGGAFADGREAAAAGRASAPGSDVRGLAAALFGRMVGNEYADEARGLEDVDMTLLDRASRWSDEWRREGHLAGVAEGHLAGVAEGRREMLVSMVGARFGPETATRVQGSLATADAGRLAAAGELLVHADSADALLAGLGALGRGSSER